MTDQQLERFLRKIRVNKVTGCWEWIGARTGWGYGHIGKHGIAHRISYEHYVGLISPGMEIDHTCMVKHCVNPEHLEQVTHCENNIRAAHRKENFNAAKTHCKHGHEFTEENIIYDKKLGHRHCRTCNKLRKAGTLYG